MGHFADFFAATTDELRTGFPHRHSVEKELRDRETVNPFTGKAMKSRAWLPIAPVPAPPAALRFPNEAEQTAFKKLPHVELKNIDPVTLSTLQEILGVHDYDDAINELYRLQLVTPGAEDQMYVLPSDFVSALATMGDPAGVGDQWCKTEELREWWSGKAAEDVLVSLRTLARSALDSNRKVICWIYGY